MAIFGKDTATGAADVRSSGGDGTLSVIATGMTIIGDIQTEGIVKIEGRVEGSVRAGRQVLVGRQGEVEGDIASREAVIGGHVTGTITATERVEIQGTASVTGDIATRTIAVNEGGRINGTVRSTEADTQEDGESASEPADYQAPVAMVR